MYLPLSLKLPSVDRQSLLSLFLIQPAMDVLPPPDYPPDSSQYPQIPTRTPAATLEKMHAFCVSGDIQKFREILDSPTSSSSPEEEDFDICDFYAIMIEAIKRDDAQFIQELLGRGLPMHPVYALEAIKVKSKDALNAFIQIGMGYQSASERA